MKIRVWKLGSMEHKIYPTDRAFVKLRDILSHANNTNEILDIIWGPDLTVQEIEVDENDLDVIASASPSGFKIKAVIEKKEPGS